MAACYCTGKCRELGYCPNTVRPIGPWRPQSPPWRSSCPRCNPPITLTFYSPGE